MPRSAGVSGEASTVSGDVQNEGAEGSEETAGPFRVMVVDDHPVWRDGIRADLERLGVATVVAEAADGGEAIEAARKAMPQIVVMDLSLPSLGGRTRC